MQFDDYPEFKPNLTPSQIFYLGSFGGTYWRPIHSSVTNKDYKNKHKKYKWASKIDDKLLTLPWTEYDKSINFYNVKVGSTLEFWERSGWISKYHPYGWMQWYCDFYEGKRCPDDERQINRWIRTAGPKSSPKIRQTLQHWAYILTEDDLV
eukprot:gene11618-12676_t